MPSSAQVSFISTPFSHFITFTTSSSDLYNEPTSLNISCLVADFIGLWSQGTFHQETKAIQKQVKERSCQVGFSQTNQEEISELINGYVMARSMFQKTEREETGNKLKINQDFLAKVFGLVDHKTAEKIILAQCDLMAQGVLKFKDNTSQNHLYIITSSFILRSWPLVNVPFQSKEFFNIFELFNNFLFKTPLLIQEHQLWCSERQDNQGNDLVKNQMMLKSDRQQSKECSDDHVTEDLENHDKCSTASRSSITTHERNDEMLDIESGKILEFGPQKISFGLEKVQPSAPSKLVFEIYEGFFMGDLDIDFNPSDNHLSNFDQEKKPNYQQYHNNFNNHYYQAPYYQRLQQQPKSLKNNQEIIQLNLFTLPPNSNFVQTNQMMGLPSSSFPNHQRVKNNIHHIASSTKESLNQKPKIQAKK